MRDINNNPYFCSHCKANIQPNGQFCPECGELFSVYVYCSQHSTRSAAGVCIICTKPFCSECGGYVQNRFLCYQHDAIEISEGVARVFGGSDVTQVVCAKTALETAGLHPLLFSRKVSQISIDGLDYTLFPAPGEFGVRNIERFTVMLPCPEVIAAFSVLHEEEFID